MSGKISFEESLKAHKLSDANAWTQRNGKDL